jgi:hypothetical protein
MFMKTKDAKNKCGNNPRCLSKQMTYFGYPTMFMKTQGLLPRQKVRQDKDGGEALSQLGNGCALKCAAIGMNDESERLRVVYAKPSELS